MHCQEIEAVYFYRYMGTLMQSVHATTLFGACMRLGLAKMSMYIPAQQSRCYDQQDMTRKFMVPMV